MPEPCRPSIHPSAKSWAYAPVTTVRLIPRVAASARAAFSHSVNYRSAVVFGVATVVLDDAERLAALRAVTQQLVPGRWEALRKPTRKELAATAVLSVPLTEASVKIRTGPPADEPADLAAGVWAGVVPIAMTFGEPEPDTALRPGIAVPEHIAGLGNGHRRGA